MRMRIQPEVLIRPQHKRVLRQLQKVRRQTLTNLTLPLTQATRHRLPVHQQNKQSLLQFRVLRVKLQVQFRAQLLLQLRLVRLKLKAALLQQVLQLRQRLRQLSR